MKSKNSLKKVSFIEKIRRLIERFFFGKDDEDIFYVGGAQTLPPPAPRFFCFRRLQTNPFRRFRRAGNISEDSSEAKSDPRRGRIETFPAQKAGC